jgi:hypothetical protein
VGRTALPVFLVLAAALADSRGEHGLAGNALLVALPFAAVGALVRFGAFVEERASWAGLQALSSGVVVLLLVLSCAARSNAVHGIPPLATSSLLGAVGLFALMGALSLAPHARRYAAFSPAKP